ncbi:Toxin secretion/phage lysis holin [Fusobacterium necrophorum subsp. funduliforme]|uniref:phage holin family protein n=1 Tax=Fusobacterium necrophorum TaxID=859 RepID=UPI00370F7443
MREYWEIIKEIVVIFIDIVEKLLNGFIWIFGIFIGIIFYMTGGEDSAIKVILWAMVFDYISGIIKAIYVQNLSSKIGFKGIVKKIIILMIISAATKIDLLLGTNLIKINVRFITICFYVANEIISMLENVQTLGVKVPPFLFEILEQCKNKKLK